MMEALHSQLGELAAMGVGKGQLSELTETAAKVHAMALKEGIPDPLSLVKEYLASQIESVGQVGPAARIGSRPQRGVRRQPVRRVSA